MNHTIKLPERTFELLLQCQVPHLDKPEAVVERALRSYLSRTRVVKSSPYPATLERGVEYRFDAESPPPLQYSRVIVAKFGDRSIDCWNELHRKAHALALSVPGSMRLDELQALTCANIVRGERSDSGFRYVDEVGISIQGVNSSIAWRNALRIAQRLNLPLAVRFNWELTRRARYPGMAASMAYLPAHE